MNQTELATIDIGIIVAGPVDVVDREVIDCAVTEVKNCMATYLPRFDWRFTLIRRDKWASAAQIEPTDLLGQAREERDELGWDLAFVLTAADLVSHYKPFSLAIISSSLDAAIISTSRIDPRANDPNTMVDERAKVMELRVVRLMLHSLGHLLGLPQHDHPSNIMHKVDSIESLTQGMELTELQADQMNESLADIADQRLEERIDIRGASLPKFYMLAAWENRDEIFGSIMKARPWEFPTRLSRLTTAAVSTVLVLLMTAETWDMAMSQTWTSVSSLLTISIIATTGYVAVRQQLLLRRNGRHITEQIVTSNVSAVAIVATGMLVMFFSLSAITLTASWLLFSHEVVNGWAASIEKPIRLPHYLLLTMTVGSLGILIGALGASFEQQHHFRHVVFVDEEV